MRASCDCGRTAVLNRGGKLMCAPCGGKHVPEASIPQKNCEECEKREVEGPKQTASLEAFEILCMDAGSRKAKAEWLQKHADLVAEHRGEPANTPPSLDSVDTPEDEG